jgi:hypothetical protein
MALFRVRPTQADIEIAEQISDRTSPEVEHVAEALTWGADEHVMCALAAAGGSIAGTEACAIAPTATTSC